MEVDARLGIQAAIMLATIAGGYAVVKAQLQRVIADLVDHIKKFEKHKSTFDARLDDAESQRSVFASQISTLIDINSGAALERRNREIATLQAEVKVLQAQIQHLNDIHNSKHPEPSK